MERARPIKTFDPLLRDLVGWGLVTRSATGGKWTLSEAAQRRLDELNHSVSSIDASSVVYFNRRCGRCNQHRPTRLRADVYLCEPCNDRQIAEALQVPGAEGAAKKPSLHTRLHWNKDKGSLAS